MKLFRKLGLFVLGLAMATGLGSCGFFSTTNSDYYIEEVTQVVDEQGNTVVTFVFSGDDVEDMVVTIPTGTDGNGIESIGYVLDTTADPDVVILTINYTDEGMDPTVIRIPVIQGDEGNGIYSISHSVVTDASSDHYGDILVTIVFTDPSMPDVSFYVPHGNGIASITPDTENVYDDDDGHYIITLEDGTTFPFTIPQGPQGVGIDSIDATVGDDGNITVSFTLSDGSGYDFDIPRSNRWYTGSGNPDDAQGQDGDLYLDFSSLNIFQKVNGVWVYLSSLNYEQRECIVTLRANGGYFKVPTAIDDATYYNIHVYEGEHVDWDLLDALLVEDPNDPNDVYLYRDGYAFDGFWTCEGDPGAFDEKLTKMSVITGNTVFYAHWTLL